MGNLRLTANLLGFACWRAKVRAATSRASVAFFSAASAQTCQAKSSLCWRERLEGTVIQGTRGNPLIPRISQVNETTKATNLRNPCR